MSNSFYFFVFMLVFIFKVLPSFCEVKHQDGVLVTSWYGEIKFLYPEDKLLVDLLQSQPVQRLKHINQYGVIQLVDSSGQNDEAYSRFNHSVGVLYLLRRFQAPFKEQVSGLLHDVSHTVFSHVSDFLYSDRAEGDPNFHDSMLISFLNKHEISDILSRYGLSVAAIDPAKNLFTRLERELPDLCADRIDYILQGAGRRGIMSQAELNEVLNELLFDEQTSHWYVKSKRAARILAEASIELNCKIFATAWGRMLYLWTAKALNRLIELGELATEDILYNKTDAEVWDTLLDNKDIEVHILVSQMKLAWYNVSEVGNPDQADMVFKNIRCRIVNPRVLTEKGWQYLTQIDDDFRQHFDKELERCRRMYAKVKLPVNINPVSRRAIALQSH